MHLTPVWKLVWEYGPTCLISEHGLPDSLKENRGYGVVYEPLVGQCPVSDELLGEAKKIFRTWRGWR